MLCQGHLHLNRITLGTSLLSEQLGVFYWENGFSLCVSFSALVPWLSNNVNPFVEKLNQNENKNTYTYKSVFYSLLSPVVFQTYSKSHHLSPSLVERRGQIPSRTLGDPSSSTRSCCPKLKCRTRSSSTRTPGPLCASIARSSSRGSSGRACSAKVRIALPPSICHQPTLDPHPFEIIVFLITCLCR